MTGLIFHAPHPGPLEVRIEPLPRTVTISIFLRSEPMVISTCLKGQRPLHNSPHFWCVPDREKTPNKSSDSWIFNVTSV
jgi:hypothetical protein